MASTVGPVCPLSSIQPGFLRVVWSKALYSMRRFSMLRLRSALAFLISWPLLLGALCHFKPWKSTSAKSSRPATARTSRPAPHRY